MCRWESCIIQSTQLKNAQRDKKAFSIFSEAPITHLPFVPTIVQLSFFGSLTTLLQDISLHSRDAVGHIGLRYEVSDSLCASWNVQLRAHTFRRKPAWTDRILHLSGSHATVHQTKYSGHPGITISDHRPVSADFEVQVSITHISAVVTLLTW